MAKRNRNEEERRSTYPPTYRGEVKAEVSQGSRDMAHNLDDLRERWQVAKRDFEKVKRTSPSAFDPQTRQLDPLLSQHIEKQNFNNYFSLEDAYRWIERIAMERSAIQTWFAELKVYLGRHNLPKRELTRLRSERAMKVAEVAYLEAASQHAKRWIKQRRIEFPQEGIQYDKQFSGRGDIGLSELLATIAATTNPDGELLLRCYALFVKLGREQKVTLDTQDKALVTALRIRLSELLNSDEVLEHKLIFDETDSGESLNGRDEVE